MTDTAPQTTPTPEVAAPAPADTSVTLTQDQLDSLVAAAVARATPATAAPATPVPVTFNVGDLVSHTWTDPTGPKSKTGRVVKVTPNPETGVDFLTVEWVTLSPAIPADEFKAAPEL